jgi:DNA replication protein DnaC
LLRVVWRIRREEKRKEAGVKSEEWRIMQNEKKEERDEWGKRKRKRKKEKGKCGSLPEDLKGRFHISGTDKSTRPCLISFVSL